MRAVLFLFYCTNSNEPHNVYVGAPACVLSLAPLGADFYFVLVLYSGRLCPFLTPHSSFLTYTPPHRNLKPAAELLDHGFQAIIYKWDGGNFIG